MDNFFPRTHKSLAAVRVLTQYAIVLAVVFTITASTVWYKYNLPLMVTVNLVMMNIAWGCLFVITRCTWLAMLTNIIRVMLDRLGVTTNDKFLNEVTARLQASGDKCMQSASHEDLKEIIQAIALAVHFDLNPKVILMMHDASPIQTLSTCTLSYGDQE